MPKHFVKKKAGPKKGPKYRTPSHFSPSIRLGEAGKRSLPAQSSKFSGKSQKQSQKFNPTTFKVQHKG